LLRLRKPRAMRRWSSIRPLTASVPAVVGAVAVEVAEELAAPLSRGASEAGDFGDRAAGEVSRTLDRDPSTRGVAGLVIDRAELLGAVLGDFGLDVAFVGDGCGVELVALPVGEALLTGAEEVPDPVERVGLAATVALDLMLEPAAALAERYRQRLNAA